jgi:hypothetical protein
VFGGELKTLGAWREARAGWSGKDTAGGELSPRSGDILPLASLYVPKVVLW